MGEEGGRGGGGRRAQSEMSEMSFARRTEEDGAVHGPSFIHRIDGDAFRVL